MRSSHADRKPTTTDGNLASKAHNQIVRRAVAVAFLTGTACAGPPAPNVIAIAHVSVIDVASGAIRPENTVLITGNRITYAGPAASAKIPANATVIDGRGRFLIPGLWDMHVHGFVHTFSDFAGPLMIANGVTGARDMGYYIDTTLRWKADIAAGRETGPRLVVGARVDGSVSKARYVATVVTEEDGVRAVDTLSKRRNGSPRADFIKTYSWVPRAAYYGIAREAKKLGVPFAGHVPYSVSVIEASEAGQRSLEHEDDLMRACTSKDSVLRARAGDTTTFSAGTLALMRAQAVLIRASYNPPICESVIATLARNHTWVTPTLVVYQPYVHAFDSASTHPEWTKYVPGIVLAGWRYRASVASPTDSIVIRSFFSFDRTRDLRNAGVKLLAGTDVPQAFVFPGFSLHEELELLVRSGLTPLEALRSATYNPAEFLGALDSLGTVSQGKVADLVLLDADPLTDIRNTRRISVVIANGRVFDSAALAQLLKHVESTLKR
ncbi:MAG TPA: amidohydrolase family protein [Gemmatimonadaceae bacterium]|nr:amidohydrolase family protein [Gemmatimonadaceae bacterium]